MRFGVMIVHYEQMDFRIKDHNDRCKDVPIMLMRPKKSINTNKIIRIMNYNKDEDEQRNEKIVLQHTEQVQKSISN